MLEIVPNEKLIAEMVPQQGASWRKVIQFAKTFDGYAIAPTGETKRNVTALWDKGELSEMRAALFLQYRRYNHLMCDPDPEEMRRLYRLLEAIRTRVQSASDE